VYWGCRHRVAFAIGNMSNRLLRKRAWSVAAVLLMLTI
jgi:hypothetical protein